MTQAKTYNVGLVQINNSFSGQNYFPYSIGILEAYARKHLTNLNKFNFQLPIYKRIPVADALEQIKNDDVVFFSLYVWNSRISLRLAEEYKKLNPQGITVFGGPHVPDKCESFLRENPCVDLAIKGEGERAFCSILENLETRNFSEALSISYIDENGSFFDAPKADRIKDIEADVPSPYLSGVFDRLIEANPNERWLGMWETNRGCPFSCTYCDWGSAVASRVYEFGMERLYAEVDWFAKNKVEFIFTADANFGIKVRDIDLAKYVAKVKAETGYPHALSVQNTKNSNDRTFEIQRILAEAGLNKGVTLSAQSMDKNTLTQVKRKNIPAKNYQYLQQKFSKAKIETYADLIIALPGETYDSYMDGICAIINNGQHNRIQFNNLSILPNAEMGDPEYQQKFGMEMRTSKIINFHGTLNEEEEVYEEQILVVGTNTMPLEDWVKTRALSWLVAFAYFDKILQIPLLLIAEHYKIDFRTIFEGFMEPSNNFSYLNELTNFFKKCALDIQNGGPEYCRGEEYLNIWWPADEYMMIKLVKEDQIDRFYDESFSLLINILKEKRGENFNPELITQAFALNKELLKKPFQKENKTLHFNFNIWEYYQSVLIGEPIELTSSNSTYEVDKTSSTWDSWDDWYQKVVWYGNKKGAYLYQVNNLSISKAEETAISGHH